MCGECAGGSKAVVYVVGAGPGDPSLLTLRGRELLAGAQLVVYAGSLVNHQILRFAPKGCEFINSYGKSLGELVDAMTRAALEGKRVVRLASGDPSLYGSLREMKEELEARGVRVKVVPGISSLFAAAAALAEEYTQPGGGQSLVVTRLSGRTPVRPQESLERFAATGSSLALFLSVDRASEISARCLRGGLPPSTPVAVVYKASWPEEKVWWTTLKDLPSVVEGEGLKGSALVLVLPYHARRGGRSHLYGGGTKRAKAPPFAPVILPVTFTAARGVVDALLSVFPRARLEKEGRLSSRVKQVWREGAPLIIVGPVGVAVRVVAPLLKKKTSDPPVVVVDIAGAFVVCLTGGHHGGNALTLEVARALGAVPVITTGTQVLGVPSLEELALERGFFIHPETNALLFNKAMVEKREVYALGLGWRRGTSREELEEAFVTFWKDTGLSHSPHLLATAKVKEKEAQEVLLPLAKRLGTALVVVPDEVLNAFPGPTSSRAADKLGVVGVAEPAALAVLPQGELVIPKRAVGKVTLALARGRVEVRGCFGK
ncbi:MAG TPA: hypothetical protein ENF32_02260 [Thermosulfidibacter takaii]|uniref:Precorrin-4 C(11)-methyltransferase n=1 Tax=Thermosulfidibacter takaii TaxID=412593 RepID=A0A7C0YAQ5_9BACT|nr:hypothetical protein [Thermosulfidibacter takaii]